MISSSKSGIAPGQAAATAASAAAASTAAATGSAPGSLGNHGSRRNHAGYLDGAVFRRSCGFLVEDVESSQTDVSDFFFAEGDLLIG